MDHVPSILPLARRHNQFTTGGENEPCKGGIGSAKAVASLL
jgi:hypothetical protein